MRYRQIHLDFHTSGLIPGIGSRFDAEAFGRAFKQAHVDSVTVFAKCHHGWSYHPTKVGKTHPNLDFDLLRAQIDALHAEGINAPIYVTATWDELAAAEHPEWRTVSPDGTMPREGSGPLGAGWAYLDFASPFVDYFVAQVEEVMELFPDGDGLFVDICFQLPSCSVFAQRKMEAQRLDWTDPAHREQFTHQTTLEFFERVSDAVHKYDPKRPLFWNFGHVRRNVPDFLNRFFTHLEIESLPTADWGYEHFPVSARYAEALGLPYLGMTGKFHQLWGEVGGYKTPEALTYECGAMLAQGARCSIGDHLHPTGAIDKSTYANIAPAYARVEQCEPWAVETANRAEIAVLGTEAMSDPLLSGVPGHHNVADEGVVRILLESKFTFDLVGPDGNFTPYRLLILPDAVAVDAKLKRKIEEYLGDGGRLLLTGSSGIDPDRGFVFETGARWIGTSANSQGDYVLPEPELRAEFVADPLFMYAPAERAEVTDGTSLGDVYEPYFNRDPRHFSGHVNTPSKPEPAGYPAGTTKGAVTWFAFPICSAYHRVGSVAMLEIGEKLIEKALGAPRMLETSLPRAGRATVRTQPAQNRDVVHLLHAAPVLRGKLRGANVQPIQDLVTLHDIAVSVETTAGVAGIRRVPSGDALPFEEGGGRVSFTVPRLTGHEMIEIAYAG